MIGGDISDSDVSGDDMNRDDMFFAEGDSREPPPRPPRHPRPPRGPRGRRPPRPPRGPKGPRRGGRRPPRKRPPRRPLKRPPQPPTELPDLRSIPREEPRTNLEVVERTTWSCMRPRAKMQFLQRPVSAVQFFLNTKTDCCDSLESCTQACRDIQERHMTKARLADIAYNFLVGGDGRIYEGRGWLYQGFSNARSRSVNIAFIGKHTARDIDVDFLDKAMCFIYLSMADKEIKDDYATEFYLYPFKSGRLSFV